jgi:hypothetical protein
MSSSVEEFAAVYLVGGLIWVAIEHFKFNQNYEELDTVGQVAIAFSQQIVHYIRGMLTWPLYVVEDLLIYADNRWVRS